MLILNLKISKIGLFSNTALIHYNIQCMTWRSIFIEYGPIRLGSLKQALLSRPSKKVKIDVKDADHKLWNKIWIQIFISVLRLRWFSFIIAGLTRESGNSENYFKFSK